MCLDLTDCELLSEAIFLQDLTHASSSSDPNRIVGGKSGGILNEALLQEYREAAKVTYIT